MKRLIVKEFEIDKNKLNEKYGDEYRLGEKYSCFVDPKTGKFYRPVNGYEVKGNDLSHLFVEVK